MTNRLAVWRRLGAGLVLGGGAAFGQAPYDLPLLLLAAFAAAFWLFRQQASPLHAAVFGWAFGVGYFAHALRWIVSPFLVDVARHGWMAPFALVFLAAGLALFWGAAFGLARWLSGNALWPAVLCLSGAELIRAYIFTGFPWATPAQALVDGIAGQGLAWLGPHGVNFFLFAAAAALCGMAGSPRARLVAGAAAVSCAALLILPPVAPSALMSDHFIRLVQPNAAQRDKWNPDKAATFFYRQLAFTAAPPQHAGQVPDLVIWPETAIPWALPYGDEALTRIAEAAGTATVALGVQRNQEQRFYNAMAVLDAKGAVAQLYDKHHLVPFGEYMPFGDFLADLGIHGLAAQDGQGFSAGPGPGLLDFGSLGKALPLICYEAVFAHDVNGAATRPDFLIQITNDAWFGAGAGPKQHLAQARMRAIEQALPLARAANTGISAMIDPWGRITAALPLNEAGFVDAALPLAGAPTLYSRTGDLPALLLFVLGCLIAVGLRLRQSR
jgi:apolipoprotein N-acyltransferase